VSTIKRVLAERTRSAMPQQDIKRISRMVGKQRLGDISYQRTTPLSEINDAVERAGKTEKRIGQVLLNRV
jgi:hypothetical protein